MKVKSGGVAKSLIFISLFLVSLTLFSVVTFSVFAEEHEEKSNVGHSQGKDCLPEHKHGVFHRLSKHLHHISSKFKSAEKKPEDPADKSVDSCAAIRKQSPKDIHYKKAMIEQLTIPLQEPLKTYSWYPSPIKAMLNKFSFNRPSLFRKQLERKVDLEGSAQYGNGLYVSRSSSDSVQYSFPGGNTESKTNHGVLLVAEIAKGQKILYLKSKEVQDAIYKGAFSQEDVYCLSPNVVIDYNRKSPEDTATRRQWMNVKLQSPGAFKVRYAEPDDLPSMNKDDLEALALLKVKPAWFEKARKVAREKIAKDLIQKKVRGATLTVLGDCVSIDEKNKVTYLNVPPFYKEQCEAGNSAN